MEYRDNDFVKFYERYLRKFDLDKQVSTDNKHRQVLVIRPNFTMHNQMQIITEGCGVYYTNMWQVVFGELRPYLKENNITAYNKVNWESSAEELIDNLFNK